MTEEQKDRIRNAVHWNLASVPPDVRDGIRYCVTRKLTRMVLVPATSSKA